MKVKSPSWRHYSQSVATALVFLACNGAIQADSYNPVNNQLTISRVLIGYSTYTDIVTTVVRARA